MNPKLPKELRRALGIDLVESIKEVADSIEEIDGNIRDDQATANDENEEPVVRERAREKIQENIERRAVLENERERIVERLPLRERVKEIFKKYGLSVTGVLLAVGTTIGVILSSLSKGLGSVVSGVGNALKALGKKIGDILPGMLGAIVSFVFRTAGQVIGFLGKNAWLLILAAAAFLIERVSKRG